MASDNKSKISLTPERQLNMEEEISYVLEWIKLQPHLPKIKDKKKIKKYILGCKGSIEKVKRCIDTHYILRAKLRYIYCDRDPLSPEFQESLTHGDFLPLLNLTPDGNRVIFGKFTSPNLNFTHFSKVAISVLEILTQEDEVTKGILFVDASTLNSSHLVSLTSMGISYIKNAMQCVILGYPMQIEKLVYMNAPGILQSFLYLVNPFISKKIRERILIHSTGEPMDKILEFIPKNVLPKDFGGDSESLEELRGIWKEKIKNYRSFLIEDQKMIADETKKMEVLDDNGFGGLSGTFRKLNVD